MIRRNENILVVERGRIPSHWLPEYGYARLPLSEFQAHINQWPLQFLPREQAETDLRFKQIIPYIVLFTASGGVLCYERRGSEERLHNLKSVGVGGHIDERLDKDTTVWRTLQKGLSRELQEETGLLAEQATFSFWGVINEERTDVGHVHWGVVFSVTITARQVNNLQLSKELELYDVCSMDAFLENGKYEYWSELALKLIKKYR